ncbi:nucleophile aminohydrolase, partial [Gorgonomyces haynaldii]
MICVVHFGAGSYTLELFQRIKKMHKQVPFTDCVSVLSYLEDHELFNCGLVGSNCAIDGSITADCIYFDGKYSAVAAMPLGHLDHPLEHQICLHPIQVCQELLKQPISMRYPPTLLTGVSCHEFASKSGLEMTDPLEAHQKITKSSRERFERHSGMLDTVGCIHISDQVRCGSSSGGISLKNSGRIGSSALFGAGLYQKSVGQKTVAAVASGLGEHLMQHLIAREWCEQLLEATPACDHDDVGGLVVSVDWETGDVEIIALHSTQGLAFAVWDGHWRFYESTTRHQA